MLLSPPCLTFVAVVAVSVAVLVVLTALCLSLSYTINRTLLKWYCNQKAAKSNLTLDYEIDASS
jgi:hypothetical protein